MKEHWKPSKALQSLPLQPFTICSSLRRRDSHPIAAALPALLKGNPSLLKSTSTLLFIVLKVITILVQSGRYEIHSRNRLPLLDFLHVNDPYLFELIEKAEKTYRELRYATLVNSDWVPELIVRALCLAKTFKSFSYN